MIEKWELAKNLIDAKKALDSLWFISKHLQDLYNVRELCYDVRSRYYINVCAVLDKTVCKNNKKTLKDSDAAVLRLYTERDKHYAHKDRSYVPVYPYSSIEAEAISFQQELLHIKELCKDYLPDNITLDFVCYDGALFRQIMKIGPRDEERIKQKVHPLYNRVCVDEPVLLRKILYDIDDLKALSDAERDDFCVVADCGLTIEEGLQNRQDMCIKVNVFYDLNMWVTFNRNVLRDDTI